MNKVYKFFLSSLLAIALLFAVKILIVGNGQMSDSNTLYLYNWAIILIQT